MWKPGNNNHIQEANERVSVRINDRTHSMVLTLAIYDPRFDWIALRSIDLMAASQYQAGKRHVAAMRIAYNRHFAQSISQQ